MQRRTGILGGNDSTFLTRKAMLDRHIRHRPRIYFGPRWQCRCGGAHRVLWRRRWHCPNCGRWITDNAVDARAKRLGEDPRNNKEQQQ